MNPPVVEIGVVKKDPFLSTEDVVEKENKSGLLIRGIEAQDIDDAEERIIDDENRIVEFVISSFARDSYGTRFDPKGVDVEQYKKNPLLMWRHMRDGGMYSLPIGSGMPETLRVKGKKLYMKVQFASQEEFEFGYQVYKLVRAKRLNMVSIGAQILEHKMIEEEGEDGLKVNTIVFTKWKLFELSVVPIGANDDALKVGRELEDAVDIKEAEKFCVSIRKPEEDGDKLKNVEIRLADVDSFEEWKKGREKEETVQKDKISDDWSDAEVKVVRGEGDIAIVNITRSIQNDKGKVIEMSYSDVKIEESEKQVKHREYFETAQPVMKLYRKLSEKLYRRMGLVAPDDEAVAVQRISDLVLSATSTKDSTPKVPETRQPSPEELRILAVKLAEIVKVKQREALRSGVPLLKIQDNIPQWTEDALNSISISNS